MTTTLVSVVPVPADLIEAYFTPTCRELSQEAVEALAHQCPDAIARRTFEFARRGPGYLTEVTVPALHVETHRNEMDGFERDAVGTWVHRLRMRPVRDVPPSIVVHPLAPLVALVECATCVDHPVVAELCPSCRGSRQRETQTLTSFVDAGDRSAFGGSYWRMEALPNNTAAPVAGA